MGSRRGFKTRWGVASYQAAEHNSGRLTEQMLDHVFRWPDR
jgi:hypothetical protein